MNRAIKTDGYAETVVTRPSPLNMPTKHRKSTFSGANCVTVSVTSFRFVRPDTNGQEDTTLDGLHVTIHDSKRARMEDETALYFRATGWPQVLADIKAGRYDAVRVLAAPLDDPVTTGYFGAASADGLTITLRNVYAGNTGSHTYTVDEWVAFIDAVKDGQYDMERLIQEASAVNV